MLTPNYRRVQIVCDNFLLRRCFASLFTSILIFICCDNLLVAQQQTSQLWGPNGERWSPNSRLPDFSYAGYERGELAPKPSEEIVSVKDFGAIGNGQADDTAAFQRALREAAGKTILVPAGDYLLADLLEIKASGTVLRGSNRDKVRLKFTRPLEEIRPSPGFTTTGKPTSNYSWSGGLIWVTGKMANKKLATVTQHANRGSQSLVLSTIAGIQRGDEIRLTQRDDPEQSLAKYLYQGQAGPIQELKSSITTSLIVRVTSIKTTTKTIEFDRPLTTNVEERWSPEIHSAESSVEQVGIEHLTLEFPNLPYRGHFTEVGFNGIALSGVRNCWIDDIHLHNCDSGIFLGSINSTVSRILITSERATEKERQATGHHAVHLGGQDNLLHNFEIRTRFMHDVGVSRGSAGNVAMRGRGIDLCFDHHRYAAHANLFTEIDLGLGSRMFQSGGGANLGRHSGAWETFWGIRSQRPQSWPKDWGPDMMHFVGVSSTAPPHLEPEGRWWEPIAPEQLLPLNLYEAQLQRRLKSAALAK